MLLAMLICIFCIVFFPISDVPFYFAFRIRTRNYVPCMTFPTCLKRGNFFEKSLLGKRYVMTKTYLQVGEECFKLGPCDGISETSRCHFSTKSSGLTLLCRETCLCFRKLCLLGEVWNWGPDHSMIANPLTMCFSLGPGPFPVSIIAYCPELHCLAPLFSPATSIKSQCDGIN